MRNYFLQIKNFVEVNAPYPEYIWNISGDNYPPSATQQIIAQITSMIWIVGIAYLILGQSIMAKLNIPEPKFLKDVNENKVFAFIALFMLNNIGNSMLSTGAFEIYLDGKLVFSKLEMGKLPNGEDLLNILSTLKSID